MRGVIVMLYYLQIVISTIALRPASGIVQLEHAESRRVHTSRWITRMKFRPRITSNHIYGPSVWI